MENTVCLVDFDKFPSTESLCDHYKFPYVFFHLKVEKIENPTQEQINKNKLYIKKGMETIPTGWTEHNYEECNKKWNNRRRKNKRHFNAIAINLNAANKVVVDLDGSNYKEKLEEYGNYWVTRSTTRKQPHIWLDKHPDDKNGTKVDLEKGVDLLYSHVFEWRDTKFENCELPMRVFTEFTEAKQRPEKKPKNKKIKLIQKPEESRTFNINDLISNEEREIMENIHVKYINNYQTWFKLIFSIWNTYENLDICVWFSRRDPQYADIDSDTIFKKIQSDSRGDFKFGTVCYYSQLSDYEKFVEIKTKYRPNFILGTDGGLARYFLDVEADNIISHNGVFFVYDEPYWKQVRDDNSELFYRVSTTLLKCVDICIKKTKELEDIDDAVKQGIVEKYKDLRGKVDTASKIKNVVTFVKSIVSKDDKDYKMNLIKPYYFCFANCAFDLKTKKKVDVTKYDYISLHAGYDYVEPTEKQQVFLDNLFKQILPEDEIRKCVLSVFKCGLIGELIEKFILFNGSGRNGKGVLLAYYKSLMGNYCSDADVSILTQGKKSAGSANPELASLEYKRSCIMSEPEEDEMINTGIMKLLTGNKTLKTRGLYQSAREIANQLITILECNSRPEFKGRTDNALYSRLVDIQFSQEFGDDEDRIENDENYHRVDPSLKDELLICEHASAFFHKLLQIDSNKVYEPKTVKDRGENFLMGTDALVTWVNETLQYVDDIRTVIKMKDLYDLFRTSEFYYNLDSKEKRRWSKNKFVENFENNIKLRKYCDIDCRSTKIFTNHKFK